MRGYRHLRETNELGKIATIKDALARTHFDRCASNSSRIVFGAGLDHAETVVRQFLSVRFAYLSLNEALLYAIGKPDSALVHPLPAEWRAVLVHHGLRVAEIRCTLAWAGYVAVHLANGAFATASAVFHSAIELVRPSWPKLGTFTFFHGLTRANIPREAAVADGRDIITWYLQWPGRPDRLDSLCHTVSGVAPFRIGSTEVCSIPSPIQPLSEFRSLIRYIGWGVAATGLSIIDFLRGRWWHGLLLKEASSAAVIRSQSGVSLARDYLFHNGVWVFRPLWTYEAEKLGSRICYYFYSTNCETFKRPHGYPLQENVWNVMNWPFYMVWDEYQRDFIQRAVGNTASIRIVGPIWFQDGTNEIPPLPPASVAVFDVEPHRPSRYQILGTAQEYFVPETATQFLLDLHEAIRQSGGTMVLKRKRPIGRLRNRRYARVIEQLRQSGHFTGIDPETSALRVIESCAAVVSMPFTSTALLGRHLGKPSAYYDPTGLVQKDDRAAHGIEILSGRDELEAWLIAAIFAPGSQSASAGCEDRSDLNGADGPCARQALDTTVASE